ncbi:MAG TPA: M14 family zinc carboxypeptidase, partial [Pseudacidobacterium sp.]|nr:M14 family zinc carboxypeptidase [Pseudacidobacterium sp.]
MDRKLALASLLLAAAPFVAAQQNKADWLTPTEKSDYRTTPDYVETMAFLQRIASAAPGEVKIEPFGETGEGRELNIVIASKDGVFDPAAIHAAHRPIVLVQNGIHSGEIDGKDACLALLRDMVITKSQEHLLDNAV